MCLVLHFHQCNAYLLSSFGFPPTRKCHSFLFSIIFWVIQWLLVFRRHWTIISHWGEVLHKSHLLFIQLDSPLEKNLSTRLCELIVDPLGNQTGILTIPHTGTGIQGYLYSKRIACDFWESCIASKKIAFSQLYPERFYCHSQKRQFHIHSLCQAHLSVFATNIFVEYFETFPQIFQHIHDPFSLD